VANTPAAVGTLRQAIFDANFDPDHDTIQFDETFFAGGGTIVLTQGEFSITEGVTIDGRDANGVPLGITIDANDPSPNFFDGNRVFNITDPTSGVSPPDVELNGFTLTGGDTYFGGGGAILSDTNLTAKNVVITGNASFFEGGGISATGNLTLENCTITENSSLVGGGGGIAFESESDGVLNVVSSTISGNEASEGGGIDAAGDLVSVNLL
jgi:predicted outer membrane repeat protein